MGPMRSHSLKCYSLFQRELCSGHTGRAGAEGPARPRREEPGSEGPGAVTGMGLSKERFRVPFMDTVKNPSLNFQVLVSIVNVPAPLRVLSQ